MATPAYAEGPARDGRGTQVVGGGAVLDLIEEWSLGKAADYVHYKPLIVALVMLFNHTGGPTAPAFPPPYDPSPPSPSRPAAASRALARVRSKAKELAWSHGSTRQRVTASWAFNGPWRYPAAADGATGANAWRRAEPEPAPPPPPPPPEPKAAGSYTPGKTRKGGLEVARLYKESLKGSACLVEDNAALAAVPYPRSMRERLGLVRAAPCPVIRPLRHCCRA
jgi:hypothetical protein